jgi:TonB family protein
MDANDCTQAEVVAGAIALGEAGDAARDWYRRHLSQCRGCVADLAGEREIERTASWVAEARDGESWEPDVRAALRRHSRGTGRSWRFALSALAGAAVLAAGTYALLDAGAHRIGVSAQHPIVIGYDGQRILVERRAPAAARPPSAAARPPSAVRPARAAARPGPKIYVVHNVVTLAPPRSTAAVTPSRSADKANGASVKARPAPARSVVAEASVPTERDERSVSALRTAETAPPPAQRAESLAVIPPSVVIHDVFPLGGEDAIVPRPTAIAYSENAEGTTAFEVSVDERGVAVRCTITEASGYLVLDEAVCRAAMRARYSPRTINGRAVPSVYRDAFTFRSGDD